MAYQAIGIGGSADDGTGDSLRIGGTKVNSNFSEVYNILGDGTTLTSGISATTTTVTLTAPILSGTITGSYTLTSPTIATSIVIGGSEIFLDSDADTSITADVDDQIDFKISGADSVIMTSGIIDIKNAGTQSQLRLYCESSNAHYASIQAPAHASFSGNVTLTLPAVTGTIATTDDNIAMAIALG